MSLIQVIAKVDIANTVYTEASSAYISPTNDDDKKNHIHKVFFPSIFASFYFFRSSWNIYARGNTSFFLQTHKKA